MPKRAAQPVLPVFELLEHFLDRGMVDRAGLGVAEQVLLADVGDVVGVRVLCEQVVERLLAVRAHLGGGDYELEWLRGEGGTRSPLATPLWEAIAGFVTGLEPGAVLAPALLAGFTDSHWLRAAFGTVAYGFFPARVLAPDLAARLIHSADERVPVEDLELAARFLRHVAQTVGGMR